MSRFETVFVDGQPTQLDAYGCCPQCSADWDNGDIVERFKQLRANNDPYWGAKTDEEIVKSAGHYGWTPETPRHFTRLVGVELPLTHPQHYDGVSFWQCPDCQATWNRFPWQHALSFPGAQENPGN